MGQNRPIESKRVFLKVSNIMSPAHAPPCSLSVLVVRLSREDRRLQKPPLREYLLNNNRGEATLALRSAVDDYAGFLTGNREALWAQDARSIQPKWD